MLEGVEHHLVSHHILYNSKQQCAFHMREMALSLQTSQGNTTHHIMNLEMLHIFAFFCWQEGDLYKPRSFTGKCMCQLMQQF